MNERGVSERGVSEWGVSERGMCVFSRRHAVNGVYEYRQMNLLLGHPVYRTIRRPNTKPRMKK